MKPIYIFLILFFVGSEWISGQVFTEILGRPSNSAVTINILFDQQVEVFFEYGNATGLYNNQTSIFTANKDIPLVVDFTGLSSNTKYFYRTKFRISGSDSSFKAGTEHSFHTSRPQGSTYTFAIEADPHIDYNSDSSAYALTLQNILSGNPDFLIDLGDNFMSDKLLEINQTTIIGRHLLLRSFYSQICHSVPLLLVLGNHEGELGWRLDGTAGSLPVMATNTRKLYFPNPLPDSFYSGNTKEEDFVGLRENYYAWEWGDALFVTLDSYWYTTKKLDWGWTLGEEQYNWFKKTLTESKAKYKFVFCHQLVGGNGNDGRGGSEFAGFFEMGGDNSDDTWGFSDNRPGWENPIHTLMKENNVSAFFHGHDHFFGKQDKDGIVYQEVPQPSNKNISKTSAAVYGYVDGIFLPGRGYLKVTVSPENVKIDYIRTYLPSEENNTLKNEEVAYSYTLNSISTSKKPETKKSSSIQLKQNFPNPFHWETNISYFVPETGKVEMKVYDVFGREVKKLVNQYQQAGNYTVLFNACNYGLTGGMYFCRLNIGDLSKSIRLVYLANNEKK